MFVVQGYGKQLNDVVHALNRPGTSPWLIAAFSAFLGILGGAIGRCIEPWLLDIYRKRRLRQVLYADIGWMFSTVYSYYDLIYSSEDTHVVHHQYEQLKETLRFEGQDYLNTHCDIYMQLREQPFAEHIFREFHRITDEPKTVVINCHRALWVVGLYLHNGNLRAKYFTKYLSKTHGK
ncbi:MAG TPA: hypothetical protein VN610_00240 [Bryobacteraceae bacterium]|nr:hypothetical protein [Bryobacteraceae bacterium]